MYFTATSDRKLGLLIRFLYLNNVGFNVKVIEKDNGKIIYHVIPPSSMTELRFEELQRAFKIITG